MSDFHPWDFGVLNARLQEQSMAMTKLVADGSMLKGYTAKPIADIDRAAVQAQLTAMWLTVADMQTMLNAK